MNVLAIETSCDDTAAAVVGPEGVASDVIHSQKIHLAYGGVVPELASRAHIEQVVPVVRAALNEAGISRPDAVAATSGPGLIGAVLVGLSFAKAAALGWGVPFVAVSHLEGHILAPLLDVPAPEFPYLCLLISGGHTTLYVVRRVGEYEILGETVDDAVGEAFDKVARMLGLPYPGGPHVDRLAGIGSPTIPFPQPRVGPFGVSLAGLKTAVRTYVQRHPDVAPETIAASFQHAVSELLADRVTAAAAATGIRSIALGGGAAANAGIRARMVATGLKTYLPPKNRCTDNAGMIGNVARLHLLAGAPSSPLSTTARARWSLA